MFRLWKCSLLMKRCDGIRGWCVGRKTVWWNLSTQTLKTTEDNGVHDAGYVWRNEQHITLNMKLLENNESTTSRLRKESQNTKNQPTRKKPNATPEHPFGHPNITTKGSNPEPRQLPVCFFRAVSLVLNYIYMYKA